MTDKIQEIQKRVESSREDIIKFMREICAIPSMESQLKDPRFHGSPAHCSGWA